MQQNAPSATKDALKALFMLFLKDEIQTIYLLRAFIMHVAVSVVFKNLQYLFQFRSLYKKTLL